MMARHIAVLVLCFLGAFFFAGSETGFVTWNTLKLKHRASRGQWRARWALYLMQRKNRLLSAVLVGNNVCIVAASLSFLYLYARLDEIVSVNLSVVESPESWVLTPVFVVLAEMLPKSLFRIYSFRLTMKSVPLLMLLYWVTLPVTWLSGLLGTQGHEGRDKGRSFMTKVREEMVLVASEGYRRGTLLGSANVFIHNVLRFREESVPVGVPDVDPGSVIRGSDTVAKVVGEHLLTDPYEALVYDDDGARAVGWVSVLDIAKAGQGSTMADLMKGLEEVRGDSWLAVCLRPNARASRYIRVPGRQGETVVDRLAVLRSAFEGFVAV